MMQKTMAKMTIKSIHIVIQKTSGNLLLFIADATLWHFTGKYNIHGRSRSI